MIKFDKVTKRYGSKAALDDVSFRIKKGEFVFLVGPSGSGKTTVLRLLLKEINPSEGKITLDNQELSQVSRRQVPELRQKIGPVFQDYKLLTDKSVFENVILPLEIEGMTADEADKKVKSVLKLVGLEKQADYFPAQLSGGELQRVVIARAVVSDPVVVFADEPTGNLDQETSWQIVKLLKKINDKGTTLIMATHDREVVDSFPARTLKMKAGKIIKDTKPKKTKSKKAKSK